MKISDIDKEKIESIEKDSKGIIIIGNKGHKCSIGILGNFPALDSISIIHSLTDQLFKNFSPNLQKALKGILADAIKTMEGVPNDLQTDCKSCNNCSSKG